MTIFSVVGVFSFFHDLLQKNFEGFSNGFREKFEVHREGLRSEKTRRFI
jgi:hypothetical protein